jgi:hypothetical protein
MMSSTPILSRIVDEACRAFGTTLEAIRAAETVSGKSRGPAEMALAAVCDIGAATGKSRQAIAIHLHARPAQVRCAALRSGRWKQWNDTYKSCYDVIWSSVMSRDGSKHEGYDDA